MRSIGWIRLYIVEQFETEAFERFVGYKIELQLREWDKNYKLDVIKFKDYHFVVELRDNIYEIAVTEAGAV